MAHRPVRNSLTNVIDNSIIRMHTRSQERVDTTSWFNANIEDKTGRARRDMWNDWGAWQMDTKAGANFDFALFGVASSLTVGP